MRWFSLLKIVCKIYACFLKYARADSDGPYRILAAHGCFSTIVYRGEASENGCVVRYRISIVTNI